MPNDMDLFIQIKGEIDKIDNIKALETPLYGKNVGLAGRVDLIAEWQGKLSVIDFKTSKRIKKEEDIQDYFAQCVAYATMYEELVEIPLEQIVIIMAVENEKPLIFVKKTEQRLSFRNSFRYFNQNYCLTTI